MSTAKKVLIVEGNGQYSRMFTANGWELADSIDSADLVQFTGGADVTPSLYHEARHPYTSNDPSRDTREARIYKLASQMKKPMAGICRGGQFLNVMCGGSMYQHVNNHAIHGTHLVINMDTGGLLPATSTHHQMMRAGSSAVLLGVASEATECQHMEGGAIAYHEPERGSDVEVLHYPEQNILCFQPHPEYLEKTSPCQKWYFSLIKSKLGVS